MPISIESIIGGVIDTDLTVDDAVALTGVDGDTIRNRMRSGYHRASIRSAGVQRVPLLFSVLDLLVIWIVAKLLQQGAGSLPTRHVAALLYELTPEQMMQRPAVVIRGNSVERMTLAEAVAHEGKPDRIVLNLVLCCFAFDRVLAKHLQSRTRKQAEAN